MSNIVSLSKLILITRWEKYTGCHTWCFIACALRLVAVENRRLQPGAVQAWGRAPECVRPWALRWCDAVKDLPQPSVRHLKTYILIYIQSHDFSILLVLTCILSFFLYCLVYNLQNNLCNNFCSVMLTMVLHKIYLILSMLLSVF